MFESLDAFRAHCGEPTMPIEQCPICSKIPTTTSREVEDDSVSDDRPPESFQLEKFIEGGSGGEILRCPTCHRLYFNRVVFGAGYFDYHSSWTRYDVEALFDVEWCVAQRLPDRRVELAIDDFFPNHPIVRFEGSWSALDHNNQLTALDSKAALAKLIASAPPRVTGDLDLAKRYAAFVDGIENPGDRRHDTFQSIVWRQPLWDFEQRRVDEARAASRVEPAVAERVGEQVRVRFWVTSERRLICRVITVQPDGRYLREDTVTANWLPIPSKRPRCFESLDAFRAYCGQPTMPLEQCRICSAIPENWNEAQPHPEVERFEHLVGDNVRRCPTCHRLYFCDSFSGGNDIYRGNETTWSHDRYSVDALFDIEWCVQQRVPERRVDYISPDRFFPNHVLVRFGSDSWGALDANNGLVMLDGHDAIVKLIDIDPPVIAELELAKRYATFIDEREHPEDNRPEYFHRIYMKEPLTPDEAQQVEDARAATGLPTSPDGIDMRPVAERDGDRVVVRSWVTSQKRLICRILTVQPSGHLIIEDAVIAENLPMR